MLDFYFESQSFQERVKTKKTRSLNLVRGVTAENSSGLRP